MSLRTIMIFPEFKNMDIIDEVREKFDPLAHLVRPHITLVFPFEIDMSNEELSSILDKRLSDIRPFELELHGFSRHSVESGNFLFLDLTKGHDTVTRIHETLYANEFKVCDKGFTYDFLPHMTVGKLETPLILDEAYEEVKDIDTTFSCIVDKISVEMIGPNEESIIVIEKRLES